ncbi:MAG: c-type heme family protein [Bacteriovoracaceae bacterium]
MKSLLLVLIIFTQLTYAKDEFAQEAQDLASSLKTGLVSTLSLKIKEKGIVAAVPFCHEKVSEIAKMSAGDKSAKYDFGRTSHLIRNEKNKPQDWMLPYIEKFKGTTQSKKPKIKFPLILKLVSGKRAYLEPLYVMPMCLQCHGDAVSKDVKAKLNELYPQDQATGFKAGDFRGFIWVKEKEEKPMSKIEKINGVPSVVIENESDLQQFDLLVDVRRPDEYRGELGHIKGAQLVTLGEDLNNYIETIPKDKKVLFICRSGARSDSATRQSQEKGLTHTYNMVGGMIAWNEKGFKIEK